MSLIDRITKANRLLASYAVPHQGIKGRVYKEAPDETRYPFQRDRDRIIHTQAFRRLQGKTQVFLTGQGDHYRTRLTHTMEVAQISRDIARTLRLNEDLAECIALAHDLGHPPFGHAGEQAIDEWLQRYGLSFEHNEQSHRIVTMIEEHTTDYPGLNLNQEVLEGLLKHRTAYDNPESDLSIFPTLEALVVNISDEIAYSGHDCEDGLKAGLFDSVDMKHIRLVANAVKQSEERRTSLRGSIIHLLVTDLYTETNNRLVSQRINSVNDVFTSDIPLVSFSDTMDSDLRELRIFLYEHMYKHESVRQKNEECKLLLLKLSDTYVNSPPDKVFELQKRTESTLEESVKDYISGMTDRYAIESARSI